MVPQKRTQGSGGIADIGSTQFYTLGSNKDVARSVENVVGLAGQNHHGGGGAYQ